MKRREKEKKNKEKEAQCFDHIAHLAHPSLDTWRRVWQVHPLWSTETYHLDQYRYVHKRILPAPG